MTTRVDERLIGELRIRRSQYAANAAVPRHAHDQLLLYRICQGNIIETIGRKTIDCAAGSVIVMPAGIDHADGYGSKGAVNLTIALGGAALQAIAGDVSVTEAVHFAHGSVPDVMAEAEQELAINDNDSPAALASQRNGLLRVHP